MRAFSSTLAGMALCIAATLPTDAPAASCAGNTPAGLTLSGAADKQPGDTLRIDYCFKSGSTTDLYAAVALPNASLLFFTAVGAAPTFSAAAAPFKRNAPVQDGTAATLIDLALPSDLATGTYTFYAVAVAPGANPLDSTKWVGGAYASAAVTLSAASTGAAAGATSAFFYQTVNPTTSIVRAGTTADGKNVAIYDIDLVYAKNVSTAYGDPTFSRLKNGRWAMTTWGKEGAMWLHYHEASCPQVVDADVKSLPASTASGCKSGRNLSTAQSKTSQVFDVDGSDYLLTQSGAEIYLARLTDATHAATELSSICMRETAAASFADLKWGEATRVISSTQAGGLLLSDIGIARRADGTWTMFVKGIASTTGCAQGSLCELCARNIYRTTSADLISWSALEKVVEQASVPDTTTYPDGTVWLYYQNFGPACAANDIRLAERAPITGVYEKSDHTLASGGNAVFAREAFESNTALHYPTNGNPIALPDAAARTALDQCMGTTAR